MSIPNGYLTAIFNDPELTKDEMVQKVFPLLYDEFRKRAANLMRDERREHTLQPTEIVNEVWIGLHNSKKLEIRDRKHFFTLSARIMRNFLVEYVRRQRAHKRDGGQKVTLTDHLGLRAAEPGIDIIELHEALAELEGTDRGLTEKKGNRAKVIELRYFGGYTIEETANLLDITVDEVKSKSKVAQMWLAVKLRRV
jgi:RNA polymerase sigma factor (TIGR02999 family)